MSDLNSNTNKRSISYDACALFLLSVMITFLELVLFVSGLPITLLLLSHAMIVSACLFVVWVFYRCQWDLRFAVLLCILTASLGPFGALISASTVGLQIVYGRSPQTLVDLLSSLFPESEFNPTAQLYERIIYGLDDYDAEYNPLPFLDVISFGTEQQKRLAIEKILRYFRPQFAPALFKALQDSSNGIRVLAATAVTTLDQVFFESYLSLEKQYQKKPKDFEVSLALAEHCDQYVSSEILDEERSKKMLSQAIAAYERCLDLDPGDPALCTVLGRLYITDRQPEKAKALLEEAMNNSCQLSDHINKWYACALYDLQMYETLRQFISQSIVGRKGFPLSPEEKGLIFTWCPELISSVEEVADGI